MRIDRRGFLAGCAAGFGCYAMGKPAWRAMPRLKDGIETKNTARNLIFVLLYGAPSHVDTFDLKPGSYTPDFLGVEDLGGGFRWPSGILPKLSKMTDQFSVLRSVNAVEAVHERAVYHLLTAHRQNAALIREIPHFASVLSFKLAEQRRESDSLPTMMYIGQNPAKNGFLPLDHLGLALTSDGLIPNLNHDYQNGQARFDLARAMQMAAPDRSGRRGDHIKFQDQARQMMGDEELNNLLGGDGQRNFGLFGSQDFPKQCEIVSSILETGKGARVFQLEIGGWDHHVDIYNANNPLGLAGLCGELDEGLAYLLENLAAKPGVNGGSLLDETMIVAMGEFGRTTGPLNTSGGRDHYPYVVPAFFAGGGVAPGRVIGESNATGEFITDPGWNRNRYIGVNDVVATMYSAMGVDWTERVMDTPSGRVFEFVDENAVGEVFAIDELFV